MLVLIRYTIALLMTQVQMYVDEEHGRDTYSVSVVWDEANTNWVVKLGYEDTGAVLYDEFTV